MGPETPPITSAWEQNRLALVPKSQPAWLLQDPM